MKRDVQVGVILGVIILAIIGVFLSTRTAVKEPAIPIPEIEEDVRVGALNINELPQNPPSASQESFVELKTDSQNIEQKGQTVANAVKVEAQQIEKTDDVIEGEWKKSNEEKPAITVLNDKKESPPSEQDDWKDISSGSGETPLSGQQIHKVESRDDLYKIAKKYYGDVSKWVLIFNANRDKIQDVNSLKIGTELVLPAVNTVSQKSKTEATTPSLSHVIEVETGRPASRIHIIKQGDSLYKLAEKYYNDGSKWNKISDANKKILKDQKSLKIGQELVIPDI